jgi:dihydroorotate dehydrogenase electron transfer subunit
VAEGKACEIVIEQDTQIIFNKQLAAGAFLMGVRSPEIAAEARPGQFVMLRVGRGMDPLLRRPFSICDAVDDLVFILYRVVGRGTRIMSDARKGERLQVLGPLGKGFARPFTGKDTILVAGGIGIAPLLFLSRWMAPGSVTFFAGFGSVDQIVEADELGLSGMAISIATDDGSAGHHGLVTELLEKAMTGLSGDRGMVFSCGPLPMLKAVAAMTRDRKISCQVSLEALMACGLGACQGCAVKAVPGQDRAYWHVCQDGPVFDATDLDWGAL